MRKKNLIIFWSISLLFLTFINSDDVFADVCAPDGTSNSKNSNTLNFEYKFEFTHTPLEPEEGCAITWDIMIQYAEIQNGQLIGTPMSNVQYDITVNAPGEFHSAAQDQGEFYLFSLNGTDHIVTDFALSPGTYTYVLVVYGSASQGETPMDVLDSYEFQVTVSESSNNSNSPPINSSFSAQLENASICMTDEIVITGTHSYPRDPKYYSLEVIIYDSQGNTNDKGLDRWDDNFNFHDDNQNFWNMNIGPGPSLDVVQPSLATQYTTSQDIWEPGNYSLELNVVDETIEYVIVESTSLDLVIVPCETASAFWDKEQYTFDDETTVILELHDADLSEYDKLSILTIRVDATQSGETTTMLLLETDLHSGIFRGELTLTKTGVSISVDDDSTIYQLRVNNADTIVPMYVDSYLPSPVNGKTFYLPDPVATIQGIVVVEEQITSGGTVMTNSLSYEVRNHENILVNISGNVENPSRGVPASIEIIDPSGNSQNLGALLTGTGLFSTSHIVDSSMPAGTYMLRLFYNDALIDSTSFSVNFVTASEPEPTCDAGTELVNGICNAIKIEEIPNTSSENDVIFRTPEPVKVKITEDLTGFQPSEKNPEPKLDTSLFLIQEADDPQEFAEQHGLEFYQNKVKVLVEINNNSFSNDLDNLEKLGTVILRSQNYLQMEVLYDKLSDVSNNPAVKSVHPPTNVVQNSITSEGIKFMNVDKVLLNNSLTGKGIKIAVLDLAFDTDNSEIKDSIEEDKSFRVGFNRKIVPVIGTGWQYVHGTAVAEIIHDVAPDAKLYLYTFGTELEFTKAVEYAKPRVDMITMSAGWINYPTDGSSLMTKTVESITQSGMPFVISAGNYAQTHWEGPFSDDNENYWVDTSASDDGLTISVTQDRIEIGKPIISFLMWENLDDTISDFDLILWGPNNEIVSHSSNLQTSSKDRAYEKINYTPTVPGTYVLGIYYDTESPNANLEIFSPTDDFENPIELGSVGVPTDAKGVISVGALDYSNGELESYSSWGPTNLNTAAPIVLAPDNVSTLSYGDMPFQGTSAAAPHVAGLIALMLEKNNQLTTSDIQSNLVTFSDTTVLPFIENEDAYGSGSVDATFLLEEDLSASELDVEHGSSEELPEIEETSQAEQQSTQQPSGGGCLIATATYGSELAPQVQLLRELRDNSLLSTESGTQFMNLFNNVYYSFSPSIADYERENPIFKEMVKVAITPLISSLSILNYVNMDSESKVLGYGISLILLNLAMYVGIPASVIIGIKKKF